MKAQRRHELKQNTLATKIEQLPQAGKEYGSRIALGLIIVALIFLFIRYRINSANERIALAQQQLAQAELGLRELQTPRTITAGQELMMAKSWTLAFNSALTATDNAFEQASASDTRIRAQALLDKGDLNFAMANLPVLPGSTTRPDLRPEQPDSDLLNNAQSAYDQVISQYPKEIDAGAKARLGLAAIAENRGYATGSKDASFWQTAQQDYQAVLDGNADQAYKVLAQARLGTLPKIEAPPIINLPAASTQSSALPAMTPATLPATTTPATVPATLP